MARSKASNGGGRLLDAWEPPATAGEPLGCIATTFTFDAAFVDEHCLARFLRLETDPREDGAAYLINREEKLATTNVCVLVDRSTMEAGASPRWDVLPVSVPNRFFHPKVSVLAWYGWIRVIIASANLTEPGYRRNQEVFGVLDFHQGGEVPTDLLFRTVEFLRAIAPLAPGSSDEAGPKQRFLGLLDRITEEAKGWPRTPPRQSSWPRVEAVFLGPFEGFRGSLVDRLGKLARDRGGPAHSACVLSPFFDQSETSPYAPAQRLLDALTERGDREIEYMVPGEKLADGGWRLRAPRSLVALGKKRAELPVYPVTEDADGELRSLHAKGVWLWNDNWHVYMMGSSNFTSAGLGLTAGSSNVEANLAYVFPEDQKLVGPMEATLPACSDGMEDLSKVVWDPIPVEEDAELDGNSVLPLAFEEALFEPQGSGGILQLRLGEALPESWTIHALDDDRLVYSADQWHAGHRAKLVAVPWPFAAVPLNALQVKWRDSAGDLQSAHWPVGVADRGQLLPPDDLRNLSLETLVEILGSRLPLHEAVSAAKRKANQSGVSGSQYSEEIDPLRRVRTETFLLQRTRRVAKAIERLVEILNAPLFHRDTLAWRLRGPVGPIALARAIVEAARLPAEGAFLLSEVSLALCRLDTARMAVGVSTEEIGREVASVSAEIKVMANQCLESQGVPVLLRKYVEEALSGVAR